MQDKVDFFRIAQVEELLSAGKKEAAVNEVRKLAASENSGAEARCVALWYQEKISMSLLNTRIIATDKVIKLGLEIGEQMRAVSRGGSLPARALAAFYYRLGRLSEAIQSDYGLFMRWKIAKSRSDSAMQPILAQARRAHAVRVVTEYRRCIQIMAVILRAKLDYMLPQLVGRFISALSILLLRLWGEGLDEAAVRYRENLKMLARHAINLSINGERWKEAAYVIFSFAGLTKFGDSHDGDQVDSWVQGQAERIKDQALAEELKADLRSSRASRDIPLPDAPDKGEWLEQVYKEMALAVGIDPEDQTSVESELFRVGVKDINPERVLRKCKHLLVRAISLSPVGKVLDLPTSGEKVLFCRLHGYAIKGVSLDQIHGVFNSKYCTSCTDEAPHPADWKWSKEWHAEQEAAFRAGKEPPHREDKGGDEK